MTDIYNHSDIKIVHAMTQVVLNDILNSVINEFEKKVGVNIGSISISPRKRGQQKREIKIDVKKASKKCIEGLAAYKRVLCEVEPFNEDAICS